MWARMRLESEEQQKKTSKAFLIVSTAVTTGAVRKPQDWDFERQVMPHIATVGGHMEAVVTVDERLLEGGSVLGFVYEAHGQYDSALQWYRRVLDGYEKTLGVDHLSTLNSVHDMASIFRKQGQYGKALEWYERVLAGEEKALGADHPDTLTTVHNMASIFDSQGQYGKALEWYERALAGREEALGVDHPSTLTTVHNMASIFDSQGQYGKALEWYERVLAGREKALGINHPLTQGTIYALVSLYKIMGQQEQAQSLRLKLHLPLPTTGTALGVEATSMEAQETTIGGKVARPRAEMDMEAANGENVVLKRRRLEE